MSVELLPQIVTRFRNSEDFGNPITSGRTDGIQALTEQFRLLKANDSRGIGFDEQGGGHELEFNRFLHQCPLRRRGWPTSSQVRQYFDISSLHGSNTNSSSPKASRWMNQVTQAPHDAFQEMNDIMMLTLRPLNIAEIEFDIYNLKERDGSTMNDEERIFLSVCANVFANFSFVKLLDLEKLMKFFTNLFGHYHRTNPHRNCLHAADSLQMLSLFFRDPGVNFLFSDEEMLLSFLSVLTLDIAYLGLHNSTLSMMDHNYVRVFGPHSPAEQAALLVLFHELFHDENYFLGRFYSSPSPMVLALIRESLSEIVLNASPSEHSRLRDDLKHIGSSHEVKNEDITRLLSTLVYLSSNSFAFRQRHQYIRWGMSLRDELQREEDELARRAIHNFFLSRLSLNDECSFLSDYCASLRSTVQLCRGIVPVDLFDNFVRNCEKVTAEELPFVPETPHSITPPYTPWEDNTSTVTEILQNTSTFAHSLNREVSKMAILNASPQRTHGSYRAGSFTEGRSDSDFADDSQFLSDAGHVCRPEHCFLLLQLYNNCELSAKPLDGFLYQAVFLALQFDPKYLSLEARNKFITPDAADYVGLGRFILENEEAPTTAEPLVNGHNPFTGTDGFILKLMEMYRQRSQIFEASQPPIEDATVMAIDEFHMSGEDYPTAATLNGSHRNSPLVDE